ncbi:MAG: hypothetical protein WBC44_14415, partial [Planctomycetaceae bacterium]
LDELHSFLFELDRELTTRFRHELSFRFHDTLLTERPRNVGKSNVYVVEDRPPVRWIRIFAPEKTRQSASGVGS